MAGSRESWRFGSVAAAKLPDNREPGVPPRFRDRALPSPPGDLAGQQAALRSGAGLADSSGSREAPGRAAAGGFRSGVRVAQPPDLVREGLR